MSKITVDTTEVRFCRKCGKSSREVRMSRHHAGFDSFIGRFHKPTLLRYNEFLDCVDLCAPGDPNNPENPGGCHKAIHVVYEDYINGWEHWTGEGPVALRALLIQVCDAWIQGHKLPSLPVSSSLSRKEARNLRRRHRRKSRSRRTKDKPETG